MNLFLNCFILCIHHSKRCFADLSVCIRQCRRHFLILSKYFFLSICCFCFLIKNRKLKILAIIASTKFNPNLLCTASTFNIYPRFFNIFFDFQFRIRFEFFFIIFKFNNFSSFSFLCMIIILILSSQTFWCFSFSYYNFFSGMKYLSFVL